MTDSTKNSGQSLRKLIRRNMIRDATITATGVVLLPSFMTSCRKDRDLIPAPGGGLGGQDLPLDKLENAAQNLINMDKWVENVYPLYG
jgi:hypothetical protein